MNVNATCELCKHSIKQGELARLCCAKYRKGKWFLGCDTARGYERNYCGKNADHFEPKAMTEILQIINT